MNNFKSMLATVMIAGVTLTSSCGATKNTEENAPMPADSAKAKVESNTHAVKVEAAAKLPKKVTEIAATNPASLEAAKANIQKNLMAKLPQIGIVSIEPTAINNIYQMELNSGEILHVTADGAHFFSGDLLEVQLGGVNNVTEAWRGKKRVAALGGLKDEDLVVFQARGEEKGEVLVFTDSSCGYCQKFHAEVPALNQQGVTVKYISWPRYGLDSPAGQTMTNVWCSEDKNSAMTRAKNRQEVEKPTGECNMQRLNDQIALGHELGVRGTPALFLPDGRKVGGYRTAAELVGELGIK